MRYGAIHRICALALAMVVFTTPAKAGGEATLNLRIEVHQGGQAVPLRIERMENGQRIHRATLFPEPFVIRTPERNWANDAQDDLALQITTHQSQALLVKPWDREEAKAHYFGLGSGMAQEMEFARELMIASPACDPDSADGRPMLAHQYITKSRFDAEQEGFRDIDVTAVRDFCRETDLLRAGETLNMVFLLNRTGTDTDADGFDTGDTDILVITFSADIS